MFVKFVAVLALVAAVHGSDLSSFSYGVADPYTGDFKHQIENRIGENVQGQYSLLESDGTRRTVDYAAGSEGFNAIVRKDPALLAASPLIAAPISYSAPISYAAPYGLTNLGGIAKFGGIAKLGGIAYAPFPYARYY